MTEKTTQHMIFTSELGSGVSALDRFTQLDGKKLAVVSEHVDTPEEIAAAEAEAHAEFLAYCAEVETALRNEHGFDAECAKEAVDENSELLVEMSDEDKSPQEAAAELA